MAFRDIPEAEYTQWAAIYDRAASTVNGRGDALDEAAELIEKDMFLLGATAIEDKLQDGVPDTIHTLQMAGIKVCFLCFFFEVENVARLIYLLGLGIDRRSTRDGYQHWNVM